LHSHLQCCYVKKKRHTHARLLALWWESSS
jgi:hypothetical protein